MTSLNSNILLAHGNLFDDSEFVSMVPLTEAGHPLSKLKDKAMYEFARMAYTPGQKYISMLIDLRKQKQVGLVSLLKTNLPQDAMFTVTLYETLGGSPVFDSGSQEVFFSGGGFGTDYWGDFNWGNYTPLEDLTGFNRHLIYPLPQTVSARYVKIYVEMPKINDTALQAARCWISNVYQPTLNIQYGAEVLPIDQTKVKESESGVRSYGSKTIRRAMNISFNDMESKEFFSRLFGPIIQQSGKTAEVFAILDPTDRQSLHYQSVYGNIRDPDKASHSFWRRLTTSMFIDEAV